MKAEGKSLSDIATIFGLKHEEDVRNRIAVGNIPNIIKTGLDVSIKEAIHYLLPLRIETSRNPDNGNERVYDYSEVTACIDLLD
jgi:hypothetical protein